MIEQQQKKVQYILKRMNPKINISGEKQQI